MLHESLCRPLCRLLALFALLAPAVAGALVPVVQTVVFGEGNTQYESGPIDVGRTIAQVRLNTPTPYPSSGGGLVCDSARLERHGTALRIVVTYDEQLMPTVTCHSMQNVTLGELQAGAYSIVTTLVRADASVVVEVQSTFKVEARGDVCGLTPNATLLELGYPAENPTAFIERYNQDADLRHSLGDVTMRSWQPRSGFSIISADYPALADTQRVLAALRGSGYFTSVANIGLNGGCVFLCTPDILRTSVEYYHAGNDRYFFTDEPGEIAKLDNSATAGGWVRTGESWRVIHSPGYLGPVVGKQQMVYRFWNQNASGVPSHFFTVDRQECAQLRDGKKTGWTFEGAPFWARFPKSGVCIDGVPLYRLYNNARGGAPSHRFATRAQVVSRMQADGWIAEGIAMCVQKTP